MLKTLSPLCRAFGSATNTRVAQAIIASLLLLIGVVAIAGAAPAPVVESDGQIASPLAAAVDWTD